MLPFLRNIPDRMISHSQGMCIDMSGSYFSVLKERIDNQEVLEKLVTIDRFHLAKLIGEKAEKERKKKEHKKNEATLEALNRGSVVESESKFLNRLANTNTQSPHE